MGAYITLEEAKKHLNIDLDYTGDDQYIEDLILDVEEIVESEICKPISEIVSEKGAFPRACAGRCSFSSGLTTRTEKTKFRTMNRQG